MARQDCRTRPFCGRDNSCNHRGRNQRELSPQLGTAGGVENSRLIHAECNVWAESGSVLCDIVGEKPLPASGHQQSPQGSPPRRQGPRHLRFIKYTPHLISPTLPVDSFPSLHGALLPTGTSRPCPDEVALLARYPVKTALRCQTCPAAEDEFGAAQINKY
jgi:hypothetical protein